MEIIGSEEPSYAAEAIYHLRQSFKESSRHARKSTVLDDEDAPAPKPFRSQSDICDLLGPAVRLENMALLRALFHEETYYRKVPGNAKPEKILFVANLHMPEDGMVNLPGGKTIDVGAYTGGAKEFSQLEQLEIFGKDIAALGVDNSAQHNTASVRKSAASSGNRRAR